MQWTDSSSCAKGMSALYDAAQEGHLKVVKLLVKRGASIHQADDEGVTPLQMAALKGHQEVVDYLMSKGATFEATGTLAKVCK
jgi:protein phosphatase 1 regulatory subunit 27